ncbi:hypothetical protein CCP1ISM_8020002 [Azospirillaceae bacterium]
MLISETDRTLEVVTRLKQTGVRLSIDDFGTGWSSLAYLKRLKVDTLKIDRSFVADITAGTDGGVTDGAIVVAILQMADGLGLATVAEGVETSSQLDFLKANGCDICQGYLFSRPVPPSHFVRLLSEGPPDELLFPVQA